MRWIVCLTCVALAVSSAWAITLQDVYDQAGPGEGYDKLVILDGKETYTGRCDVLVGKKSCIRGNGALIDLQYGQVVASGAGTELLITGCCLVEGNAAISIQDGAAGVVDGNTICKSVMGVKAWQSLACTVKNNIIYGNEYGVAREENTSVTILYDDVDNNPKGNYVYWCPGWGGGTWQSFVPQPGTGEIHADPLFKDYNNNDLNITEKSPCRGAGENGKDMGGRPYPTGIAPASLGRVKALFN